MNVPYYKTKKRTRPFFREKSGSLIIHENVFFWEENNFSKNNRIFFGQSVFGFGKNTLGTTTCEILGKILGAVLEISDRLQIMIFVSKFKNFFSKSPNGSIRKVNQLESIFQHFLRILPITGHPKPRLRFFLVKRSSDFERTYWGLPWVKIWEKSLERFLRYATVSKLIFCLQIQIFFFKVCKWLNSQS